ncbi:MAG: hypothetical protein MUF56_08480 [Solirubrobacteraceae bacterium]|nr:hypothetical protein [Solirubrobacteraceae bacterium]
MAGLATEAEAGQWAALARIEAAIGELPAGAQREELAARARLLRGTLLWQLDAAYKARLRRVQSDLRATAAGVEEAGRRLALVAQAGEAAPLDTQGFARRIGALATRTAELGPRIDAVAAAQERVLARLAVQELEAQKRRLGNYAMQAQFALAALHDGATAGVTR